ncbi:SurA N-terminal domain-containing protein [Rheinheimera sp. MMS21-TC3]|uniref:SurA N-terminal domain-containing protein n=1 Tax=Rheinheimera sp. MMS21-TC3 TaxID=3072790 RepID=UPI0028C3A294|nr:SurA N-terminal domain-containing protein [Rheinheimera sp. MMS21-TC3]WNO61453.1 SurA N-terminal domain-containing protein [Rheinheimera sp. MMS21-TC3]
MLEKIREGSQGIFAKTILGLVILTFALAGVGSYLSSPAEVNVATVNGDKISKAEFDQAFQNERTRLQQQFGEMYATLAADPAYMNNFRSEVLERLIDERLQQQFATKLGLRVSDEQIRDAIRDMVEFQIDGQFNNDRYIALLRQSGYQPEQFRELMREQMSRNQLLIGVLGSDFATVNDMQQLMKLQQQSRDVEYARIAAANFAADVNLTQQMLEDYYTTHIAQYQTEQKVAVEYVELSAETLAKNITITEQQIQQFYNDNKALYSSKERRKVAHIMLESEEADAEVEAKAKQLLAQLQAGADFAKLAQTESADTFSAENGGELDWLALGDMDEDFETAAFALTAEEQLSPVVKTAYGYHIIKLIKLEAAQQQDLAEVSAEIAQRLQEDQAATEFYDAKQRLAEVSFEVYDSLEDAALAIDAKVVATPLFSRTNASAPLNAPVVMAKIFDADFIADKINSDVIELDKQHVIVVRVKQSEPARTQGLDEVKASVEAAVKAEQAASLAKAKGQELLANFKQSTDAEVSFAQFIAASNLTLEQAMGTPRFGGTLDGQIRAKAFAMAKPIDSQPAVDMVELANGDVALVSVVAVKDADITVVPNAEQLERLAEQNAQQSYAAVLASLRAQAEITRNLRATQTNDSSM